MNVRTVDTEYLILENIQSSPAGDPPLRQRDMARTAGLSLGMTNAILKRLAQKGWITAKKLNSRNVRYAVTPEGINEIARRGYGYFKRTIGNLTWYRERVEELVRGARGRNIATIILAGASELDFIIEHFCRHYGISFLKAAEGATALQALDGRTLVIFAEGAREAPFAGEFRENVFYLSRMAAEGEAGESGWGSGWSGS